MCTTFSDILSVNFTNSYVQTMSIAAAQPVQLLLQLRSFLLRILHILWQRVQSYVTHDQGSVTW